MSEPRCALDKRSDSESESESESSGDDFCTICEPLELSCESDSCDSEREYPNTRHMARNDYSEITDLSPYFSRHVKAMDIYTSFEDVELYNYLLEYGLIESFIVLRADPYADVFVSYRSSLSVLRLMVRDHYLESEPLVFRQVWPEVDPDYPFFRKCGRQPIILRFIFFYQIEASVIWHFSVLNFPVLIADILDALLVNIASDRASDFGCNEVWHFSNIPRCILIVARLNPPVDNEPRVQNTELLRRELPPPDLRNNDFRSMGNVFVWHYVYYYYFVREVHYFHYYHNPVPPPPPRQEVQSSPESEQAETVQSDGGSPDERFVSVLWESFIDNIGTWFIFSTQSPSVSEGTVTSEPRPRVFQAMRVPIMVRDLPPRSSDSSIKDGLYHKFKKYGKVVEVKVIGSGSSRYAIVHFRREVDAQAALENAMNEVFFGKPLNAVLASSEMDVEDNEKRPLARDVDCYHPKSSRTLYVGNLDNRLREEDLTKHFNQFGEILDVDIKNRDTPAPFCFIQFADIVSVVNAILAMETDGIIGRNKVKVGFGKPVPTTMVWIDDLPTHVTEVYLRRKLGFYGCVIDVIIDAQMHQAVVVFDDVDAAQKAVQGMKGSKIYEARIQVDFCSREMYDLFIDRMHKAGLLKNSPCDSGLAESIGSRSTAKSNKRKATSELKHCTFKRERERERERDQSLISSDSMLSPGSSSDGRQTRANSECSSVGGGSVKLDTILSGDSIAGKDRRAKVSRTQLESSKVILNDVQFDCSTALIFCSSDWEQHQTCV
ncbi:Uncharacterized protein T05_8634 [Trichinella murrelli]|uniref:RRM domain-containing protein n=1 Tax=Trichinella murrelli TaxID=144512 RepID=A0A0V0TC12_9BILA|nr:Uncharacterized protein T05_8634 [Trichinella murrelli]